MIENLTKLRTKLLDACVPIDSELNELSDKASSYLFKGYHQFEPEFNKALHLKGILLTLEDLINDVDELIEKEAYEQE